MPANIERLFRASLAQASGDVVATERRAEAALAAARPAGPFRPGGGGRFRWPGPLGKGAAGAGHRTFGEVVHHLAAAGNDTDAGGASVVIGAMTVANGQPAAAERLYRAALARAAGVRSAARRCSATCTSGWRTCSARQTACRPPRNARPAAAELGGNATCPRTGFRWTVVRAGLQVAVGQFELALADLSKPSSATSRLPARHPPAARGQARVLIRSGRLDEARAWARDHAVVDAHPTGFAREDEVLTYARLVAAERQPAGRTIARSSTC